LAHLGDEGEIFVELVGQSTHLGLAGLHHLGVHVILMKEKKIEKKRSVKE
jgi:hypothetical protein